ncbi:hypothetical protein Tco_0706885 [Tanacetum coccineum]|uniref:CCHC-type domain-containing protein n=1 Tax=Tanacetum coccineum TaxID=301880 RepID=A0ABQ4Y8M9_9ASTR
MTTSAEHIIIAGAENHPPMLEKSMYDSWTSIICLFIKGKKHGRMMLDSIDNVDCDVQATNIILHGLPPDVYALVNHQEAAKDIWDRLINDMHTIRMTMQQVQVNTKFLNALPSEWSKFVTVVKLAKSLYTTNYDLLYAYLSQHEQHANEVRITRERYLDPLALQEEDLIECINKEMEFLSAVASRVIVQQVQGRQNQSYVGTGNRGNATISKGNYAASQPRVVKCYNCQGEWHMARQYHNLWDIIVNGDLEDEATPFGEQSNPHVPKTVKQLAARRNQERIKSILLLAIPDEYLLKFHNVPDAKSLWAVIKSRFGRSTPFLAQNKTNPQLENEDFQQMDGDDLEELDLRCQVAMLTVRVKKSGRSQGRRPYGDNGRSNAQTTESSSQTLVAQDGLGDYDWSNDFEVEPVNYALMAISSLSSSSSSDSEVQKCSKCLKSFKCLQNNYDTEREKHNKAKLEIRGYEISLESLEARILRHEKNELAWGERYEFQNYDLKCTTNETTIVKPKSVNETVVSKSKINRDEVIIEDWTSDDEDDVCAVKTVSSVKPKVTQAVRSQADKSGQTSQKQGIGFKKVYKIKSCFVCKSTDHLIKDCDFYKCPEPRVKNVVNTRKRVVKPVWDYGKRVNHQNFSKNLKYPHAKRTFNPSA